MTNVYFNLIQREEMARNLWYKRSNTTGNSVSVDSSTDGGTTLAEYPGNHPVITQLSPRNHPLLDAIWKHVAMIFAVLVMSVANVGMAWGADFTPAQIVASGGTTASNIKVSSSYTSVATGKKLCSSQTSVDAVSISNNANADYNAAYVEIQATSGSISTLGLKIRGNADGTGAIVLVFWSGDAQAAFTSYSNSYNYIARNGSDCDGLVNITVPSNTKTIRIYKSIRVKDGSISGASGYTTVAAGNTLNIFGISATAAAACTSISPSLSYESTSLMVGDNSSAPTLNKDGSEGAVTWTSSDEDVATVNSSGVVTAEGAGSATITATIAANGGKCEGTATANFTVTADPLGSHTITYTLSPINTADASLTSTQTSTSTYLKNLTTINASLCGFAGSPSKAANRTAKINRASSGKDDDKYIYFTFEVEDGYQFTPTAITIKVANVSNVTTFDASLISSDGPSVGATGKSFASTDGTVETWTITPASSTALTGTVTLKIWPYAASAGSFRFGTPITIDGTVAAAVTPSCSAPSSVGITGTSSYLPGQNISLTAAATGGSGTPTTYQWYHRGVAIDGATSATYTKSNCTIDDAGNYTCKVTMGGSCSTTSPNFAVRVYSVKVWSNGGGSVIGNYPLTYQSSNNGRAVISTLSASTTYEFKVIDNVGGTSDSTIYYGNGGTIHHNTAIDPATWDFGSTTATNCKLVTGVETGDFTFDVDITHNGTGAGFYVTVNVAYPTKTIYLTPGVWNAEGAKFAIHYYDANGGTGWTDFLTANDCGMSAEIPVWDGVKMIAGRFNSTKASTGNWDDKWNQTNDITVSSYNSVVITGWDGGDGKSTYTYGTYSIPTYTIEYAKGSVPTGGGSISGSKANESKTCGVAFTLPSSAVFTATGYTQVGWTTTDGGAQTHALGGSYTDNAAQTFYPVWEATAPAGLTAIEENTLYQPLNMLCTGMSPLPSGDTYFTDDAYSTDNRFYYDVSSGNGPKAHTISSVTLGSGQAYEATFTSEMWVKGTSTVTDGIPSAPSIKFLTPSTSGTLYLYIENGSCPVKFKKEDGTASNITGLTQVVSGKIYSTTVEANSVYYIYGNGGSNTGVYGLKLITCTTPAAPTGFTAGSITSTGATFTITDAAGAASYDIYYSESSTAPNASTVATTTSTSKTKAVTGLTASTTYYAWVRSVCDASHKSAWVALGTTSFTTAAAEPAGDCEELAVITATSSSALTATVGSVTYGSMTGGDGISIDGYSYSVKFNSSGHVDISPKAGETFAAGDSLIVVIYNHGSSAQTIGFKIGSNDYTASTAAHALHYFRQTLVAANISDGKVIINRSATNGSSGYIVAATIKRCGLLPACTTPVIPTLSNQTVCPGNDIAAWDATQTASLETGETATYSWKKKGSETVLGTSATLDLGSSATESQSGTYVVTVTVSADGKASTSASAEVDLTVTAAVEEPSISSNKATVYAGNSVTLTATCGTAGVTWNWYLCANADGTGAGSSLGTSSSYTIASAPAAGTYYYKAVATGTCGSAEHVYTLTVSEASGTCNMMTIFDGSTMSSAPASTSGSEATSGAAWTAVGTATEMSGTVSMEYSGKTYTKGWKFVGSASGSSNRYIQIVIPEGYTGDLVMNGFIGSTGRSVFVHTSPTGSLQTGIAYWTPATTNTLYTATTRLSAGTYYICATNAAYLTELSVNVCGTESCTDEKPTATATNNTVCSGTALTITATGYADGATTFQWQKKNGDSWNNISGATSATYTVASAAVADAGTYRVQVTKGCTRNSNEVTIAVPSVPVFGAVPASVSVMETQALSITTVEATDAVSYKWYKSANSSLEAGDPEIGSSKELMKAYADEAIGTPSYYVFCVATNSCGADTTSAIAVNVTAYVEQDCAVAGSSGEHNTFGKTGNVSSGTYGGVTELHTNSNNKYIYYTAEDGYYFSKAIVNACVGNASDLPTASYSYSTDGGENWTDANLTGMTTDYQNHIINLPASVNAFRVGRRLGDTGTSSSTIYIHEVCFEYTERCTATTITVSSSSVDYEIGNPWSNPTFTVKHDGTAFDPQPTITYSSSDEDIATVDENTGEVSFNDRAGTVRITASYAGGEISSTEYCASQGSYTITVSCSDEAPKIIPDGTVNIGGCNSTITLHAKKQDGKTNFTGGTYQWFRNGAEIDGATSASYTAVQAGTYTVERTGTGGCTNLSSNSAVITSEYVEPEVKHLVPCQYYHVDSTYSAFMKMRHLFTVSGSAEYNSSGRNFKMELSKNGAAATDVTTSNAFSVIKSDDNTIDTVMIDLNELKGDKYAENDELVLTCKAVDCSGNVSEVYKDSITIHVIDQTPTMALILAGKDGGALNEYEPKNLQKQTGEKTWSGEWPLYTELKKEYIITPLNGYAPFNKLNYEQYDIIFLTDFPKKSKNATAINNLADLVDYRPMFTFKTHMSGLSKWATKGFTEDPEVPKQSRLRLNIVCYAHPMFEELKTPSIKNQMLRDASDNTQLVYTLLTEGGYEKKDDVRKGIQGFDFSASDNFVTIGLIHMDATAADSVPTNAEVTWTPGSSDRTLVAAAERQNNPEARMVMFSLNAGAHSKLTETGQNVVLACLEYLLQDVMIKPMADCAYTFDNDEGRGNGKWSVATNWLQEELPGPYQAVKVIAPATVDYSNAKALEVRLIDDGKITIAKNGVLTVQSTIRRKDGSTAIPTEDGDLVIETAADGQGALIFNNDRGDSRATVNLYSLGRKDGDNYQFQYIAMPMGCVPVHPYFEGSDILTYAYTEAGGWERRGYYTDLYAFEGIGITTRRSTASSFVIQGALTSTESQSLDMTYENSIAADKGYNMFGNSWSAPIQISQLGVGNEGADIQKTVYIYVAGKDPDGGPTSSGDKTEVAGKWLAIPFDASGFEGWTGLKVIPAFQAFEIQANSATTFKLDYNKMVRGGETDMNARLRAPKHRTDEAHEGIELTVLHLTGGKVNNDLFMFEGQNFSEEFDNGWEATFKEDEEIPTQLYSPTPVGKLAVAALPSLEGAKVNFTTNETGEYTFTFSGAGNAYYLNDIKEQKSALIKEGNAYVFALEEGDAPDRFYISHTPLGAPAIATGVDEVDSEALKVRKIIHNDQLYIIRGGQLYDATGKVVK